jgi:hypothetical protein
MDDAVVWDIVLNDLPALQQAVKGLLQQDEER